MAKRKPAEPEEAEPALAEVHTRLFKDDVAQLKRIAAASRLKWQVELRLLVHRALANERREVLVLKEHP